jgi:hypothetical protein
VTALFTSGEAAHTDHTSPPFRIVSDQTLKQSTSYGRKIPIETQIHQLEPHTHRDERHDGVGLLPRAGDQRWTQPDLRQG